LPVLSSIYLTVTSKPLPTWVPTLAIRSRVFSESEVEAEYYR
jgi:hypothetical protein